MRRKILLTAGTDISAPLLRLLEKEKTEIVHLPLEYYEAYSDEEIRSQLLDMFGSFAFVIYGNLRNAKFFTEWAADQQVTGRFKNSVHLVLDESTAEYLEGQSIPAIQPRKHARPIDIMEFILRISREGKALYPCVKDRAEEMPGLFQELQMPVVEFPVCSEKQLPSNKLEDLRGRLKSEKPDTILFHNRSSVNRTFAAFPWLDLAGLQVISGSAGVTKMLVDMGTEPDFEADGTWLSIAECFSQIIAE